jgi:hypothetical protein
MYKITSFMVQNSARMKVSVVSSWFNQYVKNASIN